MKAASSTLQAGDHAPAFTLKAANRFAGVLPRGFTLRGLLSHGPLVLEFLRGTWCPNCVKRMAQFESEKNEIKKTGAELVYIAAQTRGGVFDPEKYFVDHSISFPFLLDEDRAVTKAYGVYQWVGFDGINIAHPATFVVDSSGIVRHIYVGDSQWDRMPIADLSGILRDVQQPGQKPTSKSRKRSAN